jgi:ABC-type nickel/cobalt efflux system permease component RcnA
MENKNKSASGGIGFTGLLTIAFIVLKLCKVIDWSWWWVLSPLWISVGLAILALAIFIVVTVAKEKADYDKAKKRHDKWNKKLEEME